MTRGALRRQHDGTSRAVTAGAAAREARASGADLDTGDEKTDCRVGAWQARGIDKQSPAARQEDRAPARGAAA